MKLFIASDIHGSAYYTELMLKRYCESGAEKLILLGDILYHGPRNELPREYDPKAVIEMLNKAGDDILAVRGNCEAEVDDMVLEFDVSSNYMMIFDAGITIFATHGHRPKPKTHDRDILLCGHTHVPTVEVRENCVYLIPGSVSIPKEASPHSYIIYENGIFSWYDMENLECYMEYEPVLDKNGDVDDDE